MSDFIQMEPYEVPKLDPFKIYFQRDFGLPLILEPRYVIKTPTPEQLLKEVLELVNEIQIRFLKDSLAEMDNPCPICGGTGAIDGETCERCGGNG